MKNQYFTKVENKYVFNLSRIFWHLFIALASIVVGLSLLALLWSIFPTTKKKVKTQPYPEMQKLPDPVVVSLGELNLEDVKQKESLPIPVQLESTIVKSEPVKPEYVQGKNEYEESMAKLKILIPPSKYSWSGNGYFHYPYGQRYWDVYKDEKYRLWVSTEAGLEDKIQSAFNTAKVISYNEKKQMLDGYILVVSNIPEAKRATAIQYLIKHTAGTLEQNIALYAPISEVATKIEVDEGVGYINSIAMFGKQNPNDGSAFIEFTAKAITDFTSKSRVKLVDDLIIAYYNYFNQDLFKLREATDLFKPLLTQIKSEVQLKALNQYYNIYVSKNYERARQIDEIERAYSQTIADIDNQNAMEQTKANMVYQSKLLLKQQLRLKSLMGIGAGIILIVMIATILVFLSIQRSVSRIEYNLVSRNET